MSTCGRTFWTEGALWFRRADDRRDT